MATNFTDVEVSGTATAAAFAGPVTGDVTGNVVAPTQVLAANGAVTIKSGVCMLTKADGASAVTLADPDAADTGKQLTVISETAQAHTLTIAGGLNGGGAGADVGTFGGAVGDYVRLVAQAASGTVRAN